VLAVKKAAEKEVGHELPKDYAYDLLHRRKWRKIMRIPIIPQRMRRREALKKVPGFAGCRRKTTALIGL
jgi:hypothetical protein